MGDGHNRRDFDCGIDGKKKSVIVSEHWLVASAVRPFFVADTFFACFLYPCFDKIFVSVGVPSMGCQDPWFRMSVGTKNTSNPGWLEGGEYKE